MSGLAYWNRFFGPDHGIGHLVLSVLSYSALWRTEGRCRYVDGRYNASCSTEPRQKTHSVQKLTRAKSRLQTIFHVWIVGRDWENSLHLSHYSDTEASSSVHVSIFSLHEYQKYTTLTLF